MKEKNKLMSQDEKARFVRQYEAYHVASTDNLAAAFLGAATTPENITMEAAVYSLTVGGKRLRPVLMLGVADALELSLDNVISFAHAIEMIHTYSLIHDDLPCMDDDILRRGKATCHVKYGEAIALLAGDALLNRAYEIIFETLCQRTQKGVARAGAFLAAMSGARGMIGGQTLDMQFEGRVVTPDELSDMHLRKTGGLIRAAAIIPLLVADTCENEEQLFRPLDEYATHMGLAFQIKDDLLDAKSSTAALGKSVGKDERQKKATYVSLYGLNEAESLLEEHMRLAKRALSFLEMRRVKTWFLDQLCDYLLNRET